MPIWELAVFWTIPRACLSKADRREALYLELHPRFYAAELSEVESWRASEDEVRAAGNLGDKPLIVLTAGKWTEICQD